jgi:heparinase II/III-like protein
MGLIRSEPFVGRVRRAVQKARGRSLRELRERAGQMIVAQLEHRGWSRMVGEPTDGAFWQWASRDVTKSTGRSPDLLHAYFRGHVRPTFFAGVADAPGTILYLKTQSLDYGARLIESADRVRAGCFDLLGYRGLSFGMPVDWHLDPTTGTKSPRMHWSGIRYLDPTVVGDHKVIWELNRHQHFMVLGRAYQLTARPEYAETFVDHVTSWMNENPPKEGVNWASSLEVSYRLIAWLWALEFFRHAPELTASLRFRMLKYLYVHATHLEKFLSTYFSPNTHLTGEALGLWYAGLLLPEFRRADEWARLGWSILAEQLERQVHADGVYFEQATAYHRYTADIYLHAVVLAQANRRPVSQRILQRLEAIVDHLADISRPDGSIPLIGDDDGGRLVALEERECNDVRATLATAAVVFNRSKFAYVAGGATEETTWLLGPDGARVADALRTERPSDGSRAFTSGGYVVMRDGWDAHANQAVIDCGPHGTGNCGHAHADALAIDLTAHGCPIFVDPGSFSYTVSADERNHFRHTVAHNTLSVDGAPSSIPSGPFSWETRVGGELSTWWTSNHLNYFDGNHSGYERLARGAVHQRRVLFVKEGYWVIWDSVGSAQAHDVAVYFHTAPGSEVALAADRQAWISRTHHENNVHVLLATFGTAERLEVSSGWVSECYGRRVMAPVCRISSVAAERQHIISVVVPARDASFVRVHEVPASGGYGIAITRPESADLVMVRTETAVRADGCSTDADVAWVRRATPGAEIIASAMLNGCALHADDVSLERSPRGSSEACRVPTGWHTEDRSARIVTGADRAHAPATPAR